MFLTKEASFNILYDYPQSDVPLFDVVKSEVPDYFTTASPNRLSPLIFAIVISEFGMVKFLLENGASPTFTDSQGLTPLMHAVKTVRQMSCLICVFTLSPLQTYVVFSRSKYGLFHSRYLGLKGLRTHRVNT